MSVDTGQDCDVPARLGSGGSYVAADFVAMCGPGGVVRRISIGHLTSRPDTQSANGPEGFSLLDMMMAVTVILIIASIAAPIYRTCETRTREAVLRDHLFSLRALIDQFTRDNGRAPLRLEELLEKGYLGRLPTDPFTGSNEIRRLTDRWRRKTRHSHQAKRPSG